MSGKEISDHLTTLRTVIQDIAHRTTPDNIQIFEMITHSIQKILDCSAVILYTYDGEKLRNPPESVGLRFPEDVQKTDEVPKESIAYTLLAMSEPYIVVDTSLDKYFNSSRFTIEEGIKSVVSIPLRARGEKVGLMFVNYRAKHQFKKDELAYIELFAALAAVAISDAQLYTHSKTAEFERMKTEEYIGALKLLIEIGNQITSSPYSLEETLQKIVSGANQLTDTDTGVIYLIDTDRMLITEALHHPPDYFHPPPRLDRVGGLTNTVIGSSNVLLIPDTRKDNRVNPTLLDHYRTMVAVPLKIENKVIGVLYLHSIELHEFSQDDISLLETLATQAAIAAHNAQLIKRRQQAEAHFRALFEHSPDAIFLVNPTDYRILICNKAAGHMHGYSQKELTEGSYKDLIAEPIDQYVTHLKNEEPIRDEFTHRRRNGDTFITQTSMALVKTDEMKYLLFIEREIFEEERLKRLVEQLPVGIYQLDENDKITHANEALAKILGYESDIHVIGKHIGDFFAYLPEAKEFSKEARRGNPLVNRIWEMFRKDGELFFASVSTAPCKTGTHGKYIGCEGTLLDVTQEERYRSSLEAVPVGFIEIRKEHGKETIIQCNQQFANIFNYETRDEVLSKSLDIRDLCATPEDYIQYKYQIEKQKSTKQLTGHNYELTIKTKTGRIRVVEIHRRFLKDRHGEIFGRAEIVRDITDEVWIRKQFEDLQEDVGRTFHTYLATLLTVRHAIEPAIRALGPDPFNPGVLPNADQLWTEVTKPMKGLISTLSNFLEKIDTEHQQDAFTSDEWAELRKLLQRISDIEKTIPIKEIRIPALRQVSGQIIDVFGTIKKHRISHLQIRKVLWSAQELEKITCLIALRLAQDNIVDTDYMVRDLRERVITGIDREESEEIVVFWDLVEEAYRNLSEFAVYKKVELRLENYAGIAKVQVIQRDIVRSIHNLLHNAIKYSWWREESINPWIGIVSKIVNKGRLIQLEIEDFGVPIPKDELEQELIFELGYRGRLSSSGGRIGSGIGLADARSTVRRYGGDVILTSVPASRYHRDRSPENYEVPHLKRAILSLPIYQSHK